MSDLPDEAIHFIEAVTAHFGTPEAETFRNNKTTGAFMTKKFDDTNRGVLFRNNDKADPKHADYKGNANVNGTEFWLARQSMRPTPNAVRRIGNRRKVLV